MAQINIRIDTDVDEVITLLATQRKLSKSLIARQLLVEGIQHTLFPELAHLYERGQIGLKKVVALSGMNTVDAIERLGQEIKECPITPDLDDYTTAIANRIIAQTLQTKKK